MRRRAMRRCCGDAAGTWRRCSALGDAPLRSARWGDTPLRSVRGRETLRFAPRVGETLRFAPRVGETLRFAPCAGGRRSASLRAWGRRSASLRARDDGLEQKKKTDPQISSSVHSQVASALAKQYAGDQGRRSKQSMDPLHEGSRSHGGLHPRRVRIRERPRAEQPHC